MKISIVVKSVAEFIKNIRAMGSCIRLAIVVLMVTTNAYSQHTQQDINALYERHKNTIGFYRACGSPSTLENQRADFASYLDHVNNLKNANLIWRDFKSETEVDYYSQFIAEDSMKLVYSDMAKRFRQLGKMSFQEDISTGDYDRLDAIKGTQTHKLIKNLLDSVIIPLYEYRVFYNHSKYVPSSDFEDNKDILIDKLNFVASIAPSKFKSSYLAQIKALQAPKIAQNTVSLTKDEEVKLTNLKSLISVNEDQWGIAVLDYEKLHLLAKEGGHDIPLKVCKFYIDSIIQFYQQGGERMLFELNSTVTKIINGKMPIVRLRS